MNIVSQPVNQTSFHEQLIGMSLEELESYVQSLGLEKFRAKQLFKWIYTKYVRNFDQMTDLSKKARAILKGEVSETELKKKILPIGSLKLRDKQSSKDGTVKFLFEIDGGDVVESVMMRFESDEDKEDRISACISSQVGCAVGCPFCATGTLGFQKNLKSAEIIEQVLFMQNETNERIDNIVYMGQGEPLNNYEEVVNSIEQLRFLVGIGARHITVSTSGIVPRIDKLSSEGVQLTLALSLHDPTDEGRDYLVPINKKWKVTEVINSMQRYVQNTNRRVTIEYILIKDINDTEEKSKLLGELVKNLHCNINLIPYNPTDVKDPYQRSTREAIENFKNTLKKYSNNKTVTVRKERGTDIDAACGQLANKV